jgi:hypothetical protein
MLKVKFTIWNPYLAYTVDALIAPPCPDIAAGHTVASPPQALPTLPRPCGPRISNTVLPFPPSARAILNRRIGHLLPYLPRRRFSPPS